MKSVFINIIILKVILTPVSLSIIKIHFLGHGRFGPLYVVEFPCHRRTDNIPSTREQLLTWPVGSVTDTWPFSSTFTLAGSLHSTAEAGLKSSE